MRFALAFAAVLSVSVTAPRAGNIDFGTVELSGTGSISSSSNESVTQTRLGLSPGAAVYLAPFVNVGPMINWELSTYKDRSSNSFYSTSTSSLLDVGGKVGFLVNWSDGFGRPLPFFDLGAGGEFLSQSYGDIDNTESGGFVSIAGGIKLKIGECFYLSLSQAFAHQSALAYDNRFTTAFGFSGLIGP